MSWFTNKGQMIQVACAVIAAAVALMVWLAVPPQNLLYVAPAIVLVCLIWVVWILGVRFGRRSPTATPTTDPSPKPQPEALPDIPKLLSDVVTTKRTQGNEIVVTLTPPDRIPGNGSITNHTIRVGERRTVGGDDLFPITIMVHQVRKFNKRNSKPFFYKTPDFEAELDVSYAAGLEGGSMTRKASNGRFVVPAFDSAFHAEPYSLSGYSFTDKHFSFFSIRVSHVNIEAKEVEISVCDARGTKV